MTMREAGLNHVHDVAVHAALNTDGGELHSFRVAWRSKPQRLCAKPRRRAGMAIENTRVEKILSTV